MTKTLQLDLQKRILIVELPEGTIRTEIMNNVANTETILLHFYDERGCFKSLPISEPGILKEICKGSEFTEEIAMNLVPEKPICEGSKYYGYPIYTRDNSTVNKAKTSFISAIEAKGFSWNAENPISLEREKVYRQIGNHFTADGILKCWNEFESKNFHPDIVIIFEEI
jgi:hypothetical protein